MAHIYYDVLKGGVLFPPLIHIKSENTCINSNGINLVSNVANRNKSTIGIIFKTY